MATASGQALTEFLISASFVLVPLFLIVPVMGKYIDLQQTTVQAARYGAWEYTVHTAAKNDYASGFDALRASELPVKSRARVEGEVLRRFYSDPRLALDTHSDGTTGYRAAQANPFWTYHDGSPMLERPGSQAGGPEDTADRTGIGRGILRSIERIAELWKRLIQATGTAAGFDAVNTRGRFRMAIDVPVAEAPGYRVFAQASARPLFLSPLDLHMRAQAAVTTDSWDAGGRAHAAYQSRGLVPTVLLRRPMRPVQNLAALLLTPELASDKLIWGYMDTDRVPEQHLGGKAPTCPGGYCRDQ